MKPDEPDARFEGGGEELDRRGGPTEDRPDDAQLLWRLRTGEGDALRELIRRYDRLVRYAVFRLCPGECRRDPMFLDARASETWTGLVRSVQRAETGLPKKIKTYLIQIAKNKCADAMRRGEPALNTEGEAAGDAIGELQAPAQASVDLLIRAEEILALRECIDQLSAREKRICEQMEHLVSGRWRRAAEAVGMPESTLRSQWPGIIRKLKACLEKKTSRNFAPSRRSSDS